MANKNIVRTDKTYNRAYKSYIRYRNIWIDKGYGMDEPLSMDKFKKVYSNARTRGDKNVTRTMAENDRTWTKRESAEISKAFVPAEGDSEKVLAIKAKYAGKNPWEMENRKAIFDDLVDVMGGYDAGGREKAEGVLRAGGSTY